MSTFDPAAHLSKQGWKGKGTALKQGHATRPLAVVQKKNLSGIGKDRDEAVPFWDQIFAATAASILTPSPSTSGTSTPLNPAHSSTRSWTTTTFGSIPVPPRPGTGVSTAARISKEQARRGLYSRFMRGKVVVPEPESEPEESNQSSSPIKEEREAGPSNSVPVEPKKSKSSNSRKGKEVEETKDEKRARRAEKAKRKEQRESRRSLKSDGETSVFVADVEREGEEGRTKRKRNKESEDQVEKEKVKDKKVKKVKKDKPAGEDVLDLKSDQQKEKKAKKAKKEKKDISA